MTRTGPTATGLDLPRIGGKDRVVETAPHRLQAVCAALGMNGIRQQGHEQAPLRVDPQAGPQDAPC